MIACPFEKWVPSPSTSEDKPATERTEKARIAFGASTTWKSVSSISVRYFEKLSLVKVVAIRKFPPLIVSVICSPSRTRPPFSDVISKIFSPVSEGL